MTAVSRDKMSSIHVTRCDVDNRLTSSGEIVGGVKREGADSKAIKLAGTEVESAMFPSRL